MTSPPPVYITVLTPTAIRLGNYEVDVSRANRKVLVKIHAAILQVFATNTFTEMAPQLDILRSINDVGAIELIETHVLRHHILTFLQQWFSYSKDLRKFGKVDITSLQRPPIPEIQDTYTVEDISNKQVIVKPSGASSIITSPEDDIAEVLERIKQLKAQMTSCDTKPTDADKYSCLVAAVTAAKDTVP